jgi:hypothetical protein
LTEDGHRKANLGTDNSESTPEVQTNQDNVITGSITGLGNPTLDSATLNISSTGSTKNQGDGIHKTVKSKQSSAGGMTHTQTLVITPKPLITPLVQAAVKKAKKRGLEETLVEIQR